MQKETVPDISELRDIREIKINMDLPRKERIIDYLHQIKNPYFCKYEDLVIESVFDDNGITITDCIKRSLRMS